MRENERSRAGGGRRREKSKRMNTNIYVNLIKSTLGISRGSAWMADITKSRDSIFSEILIAKSIISTNRFMEFFFCVDGERGIFYYQRIAVFKLHGSVAY